MKNEAVNIANIDKDCVLFSEGGESKETLISKLSSLLFENGYVKESYEEAVLKREQEYATGLPFEAMGVAIPHTDAEHVNKTGIAVAILDKPVQFNVMGSENEIVDVSIVFLMAIADLENYVFFLKNLISAFQERGNLVKLKESTTAAQFLTTFNEIFENI